MLLLDRQLHAHFFSASGGGSAIIMAAPVLAFRASGSLYCYTPRFGIFSEVFPVFTRKPIFGYAFIVRFWCGHRTAGLWCLGASHVCGRAGKYGKLFFCCKQYAHRYSYRGEDIQLAGHDAWGRDPVSAYPCYLQSLS